MSDRKCPGLVADTSGALVWRGEDDTVVVSSGPHSAGYTLTDVKKRRMTSFRYGVYMDWLDGCKVLRFDIDPAPTVEPERKAGVVVCVTLLLC